VFYKVKLKNNGDVPIYKTRLFLDLAETFLGASNFKVISVSSLNGTSLNANYDGDLNDNLLGNNFIIAQSEEIPVVVEIELKPEIAQVGPDNCFVPVMYYARASAEGYTPPTKAQSNGYRITDSRELCTHELFADIEDQQFPMVSDIDLGAQIMRKLTDFAIFGTNGVTLAKAYDLSKGNIGTAGIFTVEPISSPYLVSNDPRIFGDIHVGNYVYMNSSLLTIDYLQVRDRVRLFNVTSRLSKTGAIKQNSSCVYLYGIPSKIYPANNSQVLISVPRNQTYDLSPGSYKQILLNEKSILSLSAGTYNIDELRVNGLNPVINCNVSDGPVIINLRLGLMPSYYNIKILKTGTGSSEKIELNYFDSRAFTFNNSFIQGTIYAPNTELWFNNNSTLEGACYSKKVVIGNSSRFRSHKYVNLPSGYLKPAIPPEVEADLIQNSITNYPNPFSRSTNIIIHLDREENINLGIYDITGRLITTLAYGLYPQGQNSFEYIPADMASGIYYCVLKTSQGTSSIKLIHIGE
jgi:hypothetical protein